MLDTAANSGPFNMNTASARSGSPRCRRSTAPLERTVIAGRFCGLRRYQQQRNDPYRGDGMTRAKRELNLVGDQVIAPEWRIVRRSASPRSQAPAPSASGKNGGGEYARSGRLGHLIGDEGSGYALGRTLGGSCPRMGRLGRENPAVLAAGRADGTGRSEEDHFPTPTAATRAGRRGAGALGGAGGGTDDAVAWKSSGTMPSR